MNVYKLLKLAGLNSIPSPIKLLGLWSMMIMHRRMIGVFMDPVLACNIRCKMCYFSDPKKRSTMKGFMSPSLLNKMKEVLLPRAAKLQIGCGAEPTLYNDLPAIVRMGKEAKVPYISLTTNGQLIASGKVNLKELLDAGLNEITISLHGTTQEIYEELMPGAKFSLFIELVRQLSEAKRDGYKFVIRVNFTINSLNLRNLKGNQFFQLWNDADCQPDIIQLRPVQNMGDSEWKDFDLTELKNSYDATVGNVEKLCKEKGIVCIAPTRAALDAVDNTQDGTSAVIEDISYCYVDPNSFYKADFDIDKDTFASYHKRKKTMSKLFKSAFLGAKSRNRNASKKLNYTVK